MFSTNADVAYEKIDALSLSTLERRNLLKEFTPLWRLFHVSEEKEYFEYLFNASPIRLTNTISIGRKKISSTETAHEVVSFFSFIVDKESIQEKFCLVVRVFVAISPEYQGNMKSSEFLAYEFVKLLFYSRSARETFSLPIYFYGELTPATYYYICKYTDYIYPKIYDPSKYLEPAHKLLKQKYVKGHQSNEALDVLLPKYPVIELSRDELVTKNKESPNIQYYLKLNPKPEEGYVLPSIIDVRPLSVSIFIARLTIDKIVQVVKSISDNMVSLARGLFYADPNQSEESRAANNKLHIG